MNRLFRLMAHQQPREDPTGRALSQHACPTDNQYIYIYIYICFLYQLTRRVLYLVGADTDCCVALGDSFWLNRLFRLMAHQQLHSSLYIYISSPEERATNKVGSRNKFVYGRVHELVEKPPIYYRSLRVEHFPNTRVQQTTTLSLSFSLSLYIYMFRTKRLERGC